MESKFQLALRRRFPPTIVAILFITLCSLNGLMGECPRLCECKWKSGKESVLCLNANLSTIPGRLDGGTQVLDLTGNDISNIPHDAFAGANLLNLQKVFLSKCRLRVIERFAFRKLSNLVELDLSYNLLTMVPSHAFDSIPELREIKLNGNPIHRIANDAFGRIPHLIRLELSDCKISSLETRAFVGLESSLEWLKLDGNKLVEIQSEILTSFRNLHGLELARNPWNCSCTLRPVRGWMLRENVPYGVPPVCKLPERLSGKSWDKIDLDEFACVPQIVAPDAKAHGVEGRNVTMSCYVEGVPEPNVRWIVKNRVIANLTGEAALPTTQGRKSYMVNLQKNASNLTILTADMQDAGIYTCAAENKAGRVEASVTLAVSRKPPEATLGAKVILLCFLIAVLMVVISSLGAVCVCSVRKRRKNARWSTPARSDSYEKIEMSRKPNLRPFRLEENGYIRPHIENGIAIVNPTKKNGDYLNVPTDDTDDTGLEDDSEATGCSGLSRKEATLKTKIATTKNTAETKLNIDLHIPRLIDLSSSNDSPSNSSQVEAAAKLAEATGSNPATYLQPKTSWSNQFLNRKAPVPIPLDQKSLTEPKSIYCPPRTIETEFCDNERKYPDLLDVSSFSASNTSVLCTLPRKMKTVNKFFKTSSDSQSPLLPECSSKYSSSTLGETGLPGDISLRRFSAESHNHNLLAKPPKSKVPTQNQRSNSFLNLVATPGQSNPRRNPPSLPSSPVRESHQRSLSSAATPLLDFSSLTSRSPLVPSTSTAMNAYDYHAAQLERFLEEYRNLQEQLCKMKETCDSIRKKEAPLRAALSHSSAAQYADPVMFNAASNSVAVEPPNPKAMLKNKSILPGQPPDPPPYWLHRNAMLKRLNDPQSEFYQS